jgi:hypothetical protein
MSANVGMLMEGVLSIEPKVLDDFGIEYDYGTSVPVR